MVLIEILVKEYLRTVSKGSTSEYPRIISSVFDKILVEWKREVEMSRRQGLSAGILFHLQCVAKINNTEIFAVLFLTLYDGPNFLLNTNTQKHTISIIITEYWFLKPLFLIQEI